MTLRKALGGAVGVVAGTAVANRLLTGDDEFGYMLDGEVRAYRWRGFDVPYVEAGDPDDQTVVLVHGVHAAASNHEFAGVFDQLAEEYHVIAPDLPGFGHADRPPLLYSASLYTSFLTEFLREESDEPIVVGSSLSGAYAAAAARDVDVAELVLVCPTDETMGERRWLRTLLRTPVVGQGLFNFMVSKRGLRHFHRDHGYADPTKLTDAIIDHEWTTAHQPGARFAPASFVGGTLDPAEALSDVLAEADVPTTLVWGRRAETTPLSAGEALAATVDARLVVFDHAKLLPHVEHPGSFVDVVRGEYAADARRTAVAD